ERGLVRACHDLSEGGLAAAAAEMAFAGGIGADIVTTGGPSDIAGLFAESPTRFLVEARAGDAPAFQAALSGLPVIKIGTTVKQARLRIAATDGEWVVWASLDDLKEAWKKPLRW